MMERIGWMVLVAAVCAGCQSPVGSSNLLEGFEGIRWGEPPEVVPWLAKQKDELYLPNGHTVSFAGVATQRAEFEFVDRGFLAVFLHFKGRKGFLTAKEYLCSTYGAGFNCSALDPPAEHYQWNVQRGLNRPITMFLRYDPAKDEWIFAAVDVKKMKIPY